MLFIFTLVKPILFFVAVLIPFIGYRFYPILIKEVFLDIRLLRILFYISLSFLGMSLFLRQGDNLKNFVLGHNLMDIPLFIVSLVYAAVFAIVTNNMEDIEIDKISNKNRPLVKNTININEYYAAAVIAQIIALVIACFTSRPVFYGILAISLGYFVYSCKPFRLKRIPLIAKLLIGINALSITVCGFTMVGGQLSDFPLIWVVFILIPLSLAANFIDLKDVEGDAKMGIKTLPVLWGITKARHFIAFFTIITYIMAALLHRILWLLPLNMFLCIANIYFLYRKPFNEKWVFLVFVSALFGLSFFLFFSDNVF